jgi:hypothetical protein
MLESGRVESRYSHANEALAKDGRLSLSMNCYGLVMFLLAQANPAMAPKMYAPDAGKKKTKDCLYHSELADYFANAMRYFQLVPAAQAEKGDIITWNSPRGERFRRGHIGIVAGKDLAVEEGRAQEKADAANFDFLHSSKARGGVEIEKLYIKHEGGLITETAYADTPYVRQEGIAVRVMPIMLLEGR